MQEHTAFGGASSKVTWENLEEFARQKVQEFIQSLLEAEVTELLGRERSERRPAESEGYRNGYGKPRQLTTGAGTVTVRRPRVRGLDERFESVVLPLFKKRTRKLEGVLPELYLHGLAEGDFDKALRGLLGEDAPLSASSIARLKEDWQAQYDTWKERPLQDLDEVVYLWVDGIYVKAGLEKEKAALLVAIAALDDGRKVVLSVECGHRESIESWSEFLRDLKKRGLRAPRLVVGDGNLGIWGALSQVFPESDEQRCWNHKIINVMDKVTKKEQSRAHVFLRQVMYAETSEKAEELRVKFRTWCEKKGFEKAANCLEDDWERMTTYYRFPKEHWVHLRTSNPVESPFASVRLRTTAAKRYKKTANATAVIWKTLLVAEKSFRRLNSPNLLPLVLAGVTYTNGERVTSSTRGADPPLRTEEKVAA